MRFESPDPNNRWDSPLFTILSTEKLPLNDICQAIFQKTAQKPNMSTQNPPLMSPTFVFEVDKMLQKICGTICAAQKTTSIGETVHFPETGDAYIIKKNIYMPEMRRIRKQFLTFLRANPVSEMSQVPKTFLSFMDQSVV
ncbi:unnamed protein product [Clavelina lepadiformis]|uniref:Protein KTI12 homolog n=1 Tax=Clavelina lepadiformis TaxID=159417 RepID=A0ABP0GWC8_CLALP